MGEVIKWQESPVDIRARLVPRYLWITASIDVFLGGQSILRTGGQLKFSGSHSTTFTHSGLTHTVELSWGTSGWSFSFPYRLRIDGAPVSASRVRIQNWPMGFVCTVLIVVVLVVILYFAHW